MRHKLRIFASTALLTVMAGAAHAQQAVTVVNSQANPAQVNVTNYNQIDTSIVNAIMSAAGQETSDITSLSKALANSDDVKDEAQAKYGIEEARLSALEGASSGPGDCSALEAGASMTTFAAQISQWRENLADQNLAWFGNDPTVGGTPNPAAVSPKASARRILGSECSLGFASAEEIADGACGSTTTTPGTNAGLDLKATDLFTNTDFSPTQNTAAQLFESHVVTPESMEPASPTEIQGPSGARIVAAREAVISRVSLAGLLVSDAIARRNTSWGAPTSLSDWAKGEAAQMPGAIPATNGQYFPNGVSMMDYGEVRADSYVYDTQFLAGVSSQTTDPPLLKTLIQIEGFRTWLQWQQYKLDEQRGLMEAALLANSQVPTAATSP
jgi:hypothetical protein